MYAGKILMTAGLVVGMAATAEAGLNICNKTRQVQGISIGYKAGDNWVSEGWWNINPGSCATVIGGNLNNRYYYYRAEVNGGPFKGEGYAFCTTPSEYTIVGDGNCRARGYDQEDFSQVDTGPSATEFTLNLVP